MVPNVRSYTILDILSAPFRSHVFDIASFQPIAVHIKDPAGVVHAIKNWKLRLMDMTAPHPPQHVVNRLLSEIVSRAQPMNTDPASLSPAAQLKGDHQCAKLLASSDTHITGSLKLEHH